MGIGGRLVCCLDGGDLGLQRLELGFERGTAVFADAAREFGLFALLDRLLEAPADLLQLRERLRRHLRQSRQRFDTEGGVGRRLRAARIGAREPVGDMEEFAQAGGRLSGRDRFAMRCGVAGVLDEARLGGERLSDQGRKVGSARCAASVGSNGSFKVRSWRKSQLTAVSSASRP